MGFILVAYATRNSIYEESLKQLMDAADKLGVRSYFQLINDRGGWGKNTEYKPHFIKHCMEQFHDCDIAYTDADSILHSYPELFDSTEAEALVRKQDFPWRKNEFLSGTFFLRNTERCRLAVGLWINKVEAGKTVRSKPETWEQYHMGRALDEAAVEYRQLPHWYIYYDHMERAEGVVENPVITHMQYSRKICK